MGRQLNQIKIETRIRPLVTVRYETLKVRCTLKSSYKVEKDDHQDTFDRSIEVGKEEDTRMVLLPCCQVEITHR